MKILIKRRLLLTTLILIIFILILCLTFLSINNGNKLTKSYESNDLKSYIKSLNNPSINDMIENDFDNNDIINCLTDCLQNNNNKNVDNKKNYKLDSLMEKILLNTFERELKSEEFILLKEKEEAHTELWNLEFGKYSKTQSNKPEITRDILINKSSFLLEKDLTELSTAQKLLATLHQSLYPWVYHGHYKSFAQIIESTNGKGIVMCVGNYHFNYARSSIDILRNVIKSSLPIEIFYNGEDDLSEEKRELLSKFDNIYLTDISEFFDNEIINLGGWAIKPFSILASRFEEVILMDADAVYIRDPMVLFEDEGYIEKGTIFFRDRTLFPGSHQGSEWLKSWMTNPLSDTKNLRYWKEETSHEMESSTVVINKTRNILGLLNVCKLNEQKIRDDVVYKYVHGDKETFWIGFDMARQPFNMIPVPSVFIGELAVGEEGDDPDARQLCGHVGHTTRDGKILFWNDHIIKDKNNDKYNHQLLRFEAYFMEDGEEGDWASFHCLNLNIENKGKGNRNGKEPKKFNKEERKILDSIIERENKYHYALPQENDYE